MTALDASLNGSKNRIICEAVIFLKFQKSQLYISSRSQDGDPKYLWASRIACQTLHMSRDSHWERLGTISGYHHTSLPEMRPQTSGCHRRDASRVQLSSYVRTPRLSFLRKLTQSFRKRMYNQRFRQWNIIKNLGSDDVQEYLQQHGCSTGRGSDDTTSIMRRGEWYRHKKY
jgi:hypothetical protein